MCEVIFAQGELLLLLSRNMFAKEDKNEASTGAIAERDRVLYFTLGFLYYNPN